MKFNQDRHIKQCHGDEINDCGTVCFIDIDLIVAEVQPDEELPTKQFIQNRFMNNLQWCRERLQYHQTNNPLTVVQQLFPILPNEQPPKVVQRISLVRPASPW